MFGGAQEQTRRFVVIGAGAIGGVVGAHLARAGQRVCLVARGEHGRRIAAQGLEVRTPGGTFVVRPEVAASVADARPRHPDVVLVAVKSQDTAGVVEELRSAGAPSDLPLVSLQNGVTNEQVLAAWSSTVVAVTVMAPTVFLEPGVVEALASPCPALLDLGRYPSGTDALTAELAATFTAAGMDSRELAEPMRWKWAKLLMNLNNATEVVCGPAARFGPLGAEVHAEGRAVLAAAGIDHATPEEDVARRGELLELRADVAAGGSTWQSATRGTPLETDHLTGELLRVAARAGVSAPLNAALAQLARQVELTGAGPGLHTVEEVRTLAARLARAERSGTPGA